MPSTWVNHDTVVYQYRPRTRCHGIVPLHYSRHSVIVCRTVRAGCGEPYLQASDDDRLAVRVVEARKGSYYRGFKLKALLYVIFSMYHSLKPGGAFKPAGFEQLAPRPPPPTAYTIFSVLAWPPSSTPRPAHPGGRKTPKARLLRQLAV